VQQDVMEAMKEILEVINRSLEGTQFKDRIDGFFRFFILFGWNSFRGVY
jgi:hypothetical protein